LDGQAQFFRGIHAGAGRLLAIAQGGVENDDPLRVVVIHGLLLWAVIRREPLVAGGWLASNAIVNDDGLMARSMGRKV
jgi:hypothetical protein